MPELNSLATFLKDFIICRNGPPASVRNDNGTEDQLHFQELLKKQQHCLGGISTLPAQRQRPG